MIRALPVGTLLASFALALPGASSADDPPSRVARLSYVDGSVSFRPGSLEDWAPASRNRPLTTGDRLWTDRYARGELQLGRTSVRIGSETAFGFLNLNDDVAQMQVTQGSLRVHVREFAESEAVEVDTPNAAVSLLRPGIYRIDVDADGDTTVTVRRGEATVTAEGSEVTVDDRQMGIFRGAPNPTYDLQAAPASDEWDRWCAERERWDDEVRAASRYVSPEMVGWEDLDSYGRWREIPEYGMVWAPMRVGPSWAPYRSGHWGFIAPWGWTWIDDEPWGFAPFHYGRWAHFRGEWVWIPGRHVAHYRPVYAPALVAFVGGGSWSASLAIGPGGIAWFPLGPREVFYPSYAVSRGYVQNINVTQVNVVNINVHGGPNVRYVNQSVVGAVTAVPRAAFVSAQAVAAVAVTVPVAALAMARPGPALLGVPPTPQSVLSHALLPPSAIVPRPPLPLLSRSIVAKLTPPLPPVPLGVTSHTMARVTAPVIRPAIPPVGTAAVALRPVRPSLAAPRVVTSGGSSHVTSIHGTQSSLQGSQATGSQTTGSQTTGGAAGMGTSTSSGRTLSTGRTMNDRPVLNDRPAHAPLHGSGTTAGGSSSTTSSAGSGHASSMDSAVGAHSSTTTGSVAHTNPSGSFHTDSLHTDSAHTDSAMSHSGSGSLAHKDVHIMAATPAPMPHSTPPPHLQAMPHPTPHPTPKPTPRPTPPPKKHQ
jgi:hypothetical protein